MDSNNLYNIKFISDDFQSNLLSLQEEVKKANNLLEDVNNKINSLHNFYEGEMSELYLEEMNKFTVSFPDIKTKTENYITFLNNVMERYKKMEEAVNKSINDGIKGLSINGSENN